jgi:hypothetical protein
VNSQKGIADAPRRQGSSDGATSRSGLSEAGGLRGGADRRTLGGDGADMRWLVGVGRNWEGWARRTWTGPGGGEGDKACRARKGTGGVGRDGVVRQGRGRRDLGRHVGAWRRVPGRLGAGRQNRWEAKRADLYPRWQVGMGAGGLDPGGRGGEGEAWKDLSGANSEGLG